MNDLMLFYLSVAILGLMLAIIAAANMWWGSKTTKSKS